MRDGTAHLRFKEHGGSEIRQIEFEPIYLSVADDFAEDYSGLLPSENETSSVCSADLSTVQGNIAKNFPSAASKFDDLRAFQLGAMEWRVRFICQGMPNLIVSEQ